MPATQPVSTVLATREGLTHLVEDLLSTLDRDPARFLHDQGVRGSLSASCFCPLANWLRGELEDQLGGHTWVTVGSEKVTVRFAAVLVTVALPRPVAQFVRDFDEGLHARLVG